MVSCFFFFFSPVVGHVFGEGCNQRANWHNWAEARREADPNGDLRPVQELQEQISWMTIRFKGKWLGLLKDF